MKYNIDINQLVLSETTLDIIDSAILDYLIIICNSKNKKIESCRKQGMTWVNYQQLIREMPLLRIKSKGAITPRIKKIEKEGFIVSNGENGGKLYVQLTEKIDILFTKMNGTVHENERLEDKTVHENERIIILSNNNTNDKNTEPTALGKEISEIINLFKDINPCYKDWYGNKTQRDAVKWLLQEFGFDDLCNKVKLLPTINAKEFVTKSTTPWELKKNLGKLKAHFDQTKSKPNKLTIAI